MIPVDLSSLVIFNSGCVFNRSIVLSYTLLGSASSTTVATSNPPLEECWVKRVISFFAACAARIHCACTEVVKRRRSTSTKAADQRLGHIDAPQRNRDWRDQIYRMRLVNAI